jgi:hypothetical protein
MVSGVTMQHITDLGFIHMVETYDHALGTMVTRPTLDYNKVTV